MGRYHIDGFAETGGVRRVWEFLGCFFQSCPVCFTPSDVNPLTGVSFETMYCETLEKLSYLQSCQNVALMVMWEHEWDGMRECDEDVRQFLRRYNAPQPLEPRGALFGGRSCPVQLRYSAGQG